MFVFLVLCLSLDNEKINSVKGSNWVRVLNQSSVLSLTCLYGWIAVFENFEFYSAVFLYFYLGFLYNQSSLKGMQSHWLWPVLEFSRENWLGVVSFSFHHRFG